MKKIDEIFAENVKARRKALGYSQEKLANLAGFDISTVQRFEARTRWPSPENVQRLADALECEPSALYQTGLPANVKPTVKQALAALNAHFAHEDLHASLHAPARKSAGPKPVPTPGQELIDLAKLLDGEAAALFRDQIRRFLEIQEAKNRGDSGAGAG